MDIKAKAHSLEPTIRIGKQGLSDGQKAEIKRQLQKQKIIKIKFLKSFEDHKKATEEILKLTNATLVSSIGKVIVVHKH